MNVSNFTNGTLPESSAATFAPNMGLCIGLSALGGFLEVTSTMCLAYPEYRVKLGHERWGTPCFTRWMLVANLGLMAFASGAYIVGSFFGPVSISVPVALVSKLLFNMIIMGAVLRMASFTKDQKVGTYCITLAILCLPELGPTDQPNLDPITLVAQPGAIAWLALLGLATVACVAGMVVLACRANARQKALDQQNVDAVVCKASSPAHATSLPAADVMPGVKPPEKVPAASVEVAPAVPPKTSETVSLLVYTTAQVLGTHEPRRAEESERRARGREESGRDVYAHV